VISAILFCEREFRRKTVSLQFSYHVLCNLPAIDSYNLQRPFNRQHNQWRTRQHLIGWPHGTNTGDVEPVSARHWLDDDTALSVMRSKVWVVVESFKLWVSEDISQKAGKWVTLMIFLRWHNSQSGQLSILEFIPFCTSDRVLSTFSITSSFRLDYLRFCVCLKWFMIFWIGLILYTSDISDNWMPEKVDASERSYHIWMPIKIYQRIVGKISYSNDHYEPHHVAWFHR
jgi:hypothetical protein